MGSRFDGPQLFGPKDRVHNTYGRAQSKRGAHGQAEEVTLKLSTRGRYAVMAMADLAQADRGQPITLADIAERQDISLSYLEQLFAKLRRGGLVVSARGPGGGYRLARNPDEVRIADIILAVDEPIKATRCDSFSPKGCTKSGRCITHDLWDELGRQIHLFLNSVSLGDVIHKRILSRGLMGTRYAPATQAPPPVIGAGE